MKISVPRLTTKMARFIFGKSGHSLLVDSSNFIYRKEGSDKKCTKDYYECVERKQLKCRARVHTSFEAVEIIKRTAEHSHLADLAKLNKREGLSGLYKTSEVSIAAPRVLIAETVSNMDDAAQSKLPNYQSMSRHIRRIRQKIEGAPPVPMVKI